MVASSNNHFNLAILTSTGVSRTCKVSTLFAYMNLDNASDVAENVSMTMYFD
jgi:hypothetical protein